MSMKNRIEKIEDEIGINQELEPITIIYEVVSTDGTPTTFLRRIIDHNGASELVDVTDEYSSK